MVPMRKSHTVPKTQLRTGPAKNALHTIKLLIYISSVIPREIFLGMPSMTLFWKRLFWFLEELLISRMKSMTLPTKKSLIHVEGVKCTWDFMRPIRQSPKKYMRLSRLF